jgi:hypothetical protein
MFQYSQGLPKKFETFLFFFITNPSQFRDRLEDVIPLITTTTQVLADHKAIDEHKAGGGQGHLKIVGMNIAFSQKGLTAVSSQLPVSYAVRSDK